MMTTDFETRVVDAALTLAAEQPWQKISLVDIARGAGLSLSDFYNEMSKDDILAAIDRRLDLACSAEPVSSDDTLRERIFDVAMLRFEAMEDHRAALLSIRKAWKNAPLARLQAAKRRSKTANWILTCAEADFPGMAARTLLFTGILFRAETAWEQEDSPDFSRTMSQLDRDLRSVEDFARRAKSFGRSSPKQKEEAEEISPAS